MAAAVSRTTSGGLPSVTRVTSSAAEKATMATPASSSITAAAWSSSAPEAAEAMASRKGADSVTRTAWRRPAAAAPGGPPHDHRERRCHRASTRRPCAFTAREPCEAGPVTVPALHTTEYDSRLAAYAVLVDDHDRILLALWNEVAEPLWTLPGGGIELDETIEEGAVREVLEETGYDVELGRILGVDTSSSRRRSARRTGSAGSGGSVSSTGPRSWEAGCATRWTARPTRRGGSRWPTCPTCPGLSWSTSGSGCGRQRGDPALPVRRGGQRPLAPVPVPGR